MKKIILIFISIVLSFLFPQKFMALDNIIQNENKVSESTAPLSTDMVLQSYIGSITSKYTVEPLANHYGMNVPYQLEYVKVIDAKMIYMKNNVDYIFKIQVQPFVGAHDPLGIDEFTFRVSGSKIKLLKYEHVKSFPIPPFVKSHYKNLKSDY